MKSATLFGLTGLVAALAGEVLDLGDPCLRRGRGAAGDHQGPQEGSRGELGERSGGSDHGTSDDRRRPPFPPGAGNRGPLWAPRWARAWESAPEGIVEHDPDRPEDQDRDPGRQERRELPLDPKRPEHEVRRVVEDAQEPAQRDPVGAAHYCPDCAMTLLAAVASQTPQQTNAFEAQQIRFHMSSQAAHAAQLRTAQARDPPLA